MVLVARGIDQKTIPISGFTTIFSNETIKLRGPITWTGGTVIFPDGYGYLAVTGNVVVSEPQNPCVYISAIFEIDGSVLRTVAFTERAMEPGDTFQLDMSCDMRQGCSYIWAHTSDGWFCDILSPYHHAFGRIT
jgi:hypothetical protein